jgi:hypothetical protein
MRKALFLLLFLPFLTSCLCTMPVDINQKSFGSLTGNVSFKGPPAMNRGGEGGQSEMGGGGSSSFQLPGVLLIIVEFWFTLSPPRIRVYIW